MPQASPLQRVQRALNKAIPAFGCWLGLCRIPIALTEWGPAGFDCLVIDGEHAPTEPALLSWRSCQGAPRSIRTPSVVRVPVGETHLNPNRCLMAGRRLVWCQVGPTTSDQARSTGARRHLPTVMAIAASASADPRSTVFFADPRIMATNSDERNWSGLCRLKSVKGLEKPPHI